MDIMRAIQIDTSHITHSCIVNAFTIHIQTNTIIASRRIIPYIYYRVHTHVHNSLEFGQFEYKQTTQYTQTKHRFSQFFARHFDRSVDIECVRRTHQKKNKH